MIAATCGLPSALYADRATAEHDAEMLRHRNAHDVARNRWRNFSTEPATYTVIEVAPWVDADGIGETDGLERGENPDMDGVYAVQGGVILPRNRL